MDVKERIFQQILVLSHKQEEQRKRRHDQLLAEISQLAPGCESCKNLSLTELHVIQSIGQGGHLNVTAISQKIGVTKSAISKITTKLMQKGLIERYQLHDNQKEVYFRLSGQGETVFSIHERHHRKIGDEWKSFLGRYAEEELGFLHRLLQDALEMADQKQRDE
ncbi:MarR family transcriptional regulator [Brevibacillus borstelensis]|uniref:MarR family transcriptional regulator n=1 Tax=Brevibacillus borstelensis TaxID=45462 RepID=UPI0030BC8929